MKIMKNSISRLGYKRVNIELAIHLASKHGYHIASGAANIKTGNVYVCPETNQNIDFDLFRSPVIQNKNEEIKAIKFLKLLEV